MATTYGIIAAGFVRKPLSQIVTDLRTRLQSTFGVNSDYSEDGPFGQIIADVSAMIDEPWQIGEDLYFSMDPDLATGARLKSLLALTGSVAKVPTKSTGFWVAIGSNNSIILSGTKVQVSGNGPIFQTNQDSTILSLIAWAPYTAQAGDLRTNSGNVYYCITGGATAGSGGPTGTALDIVDGSAHWRYMGTGSAAALIPIESVDLGAILGAAGTITTIVTPTSGLVSGSNPADVTLGQAIETDPQLRVRRIAELTAAGEGGVESLRADLLRVTGVTDAIVFENPGDTTDANGLPPHTVEAVVLGGTDLAVATVAFTKGAGIGTNGTSTVTLTDSMGFARPTKFSRPNPLSVWIIVNLTKGSTYPADGDTRVSQALVDFSNGVLAIVNPAWTGYHIGDDVIQSALYAPIFEQVPGVVDITKLWIGLVNPPTSGANIITTARDLPKLDKSRITVVSV